MKNQNNSQAQVKNQRRNKNQNGQKSKSDFHSGFDLKPVGFRKGPTIPVPYQETFIILLGLFDEDNNQAVHRLANGEERPIIVVSNPLPLDEASYELIGDERANRKNGLILQ